MSTKTFFGDMMMSAPPAAPQITMNSEACMRERGWPPAMTNPPRTEARTMIAPMMMIIGEKSGYFFAVFLQVIADGNDGLRMDLADARFRNAEGLRDFAQTHIFKIVKREHLALHLGKLLEP